MLEVGADLGIALDGDGDRVIMVDHQGALVDGDEILYIIARERHQQERFQGGVVGTLMSNLGLELALDALKIPFVRAKVGDRYVMAELATRNWQLGGENSGHIVCRDVTTTGDGIVSALQVLSAMVEQQKSLRELLEGMEKLPQSLINVRLNGKSGIMEHEQVKAVVAEAEIELARQGRVLLRPSGTEPLIRVMVEGRNPEQVAAVAQRIAGVVTEVAS